MIYACPHCSHDVTVTPHHQDPVTHVAKCRGCGRIWRKLDRGEARIVLPRDFVEVRD